MEIFWRLVAALGIFGLIELVDFYVEPMSFPWWLSLILAAFCSVIDIIVIAAIDIVTD